MKYLFFGTQKPGISLPHFLAQIKPYLETMSAEKITIPLVINSMTFDVQITRLSGGMTNGSYKIQTTAGQWVLRLAGEGTNSFIDRRAELINSIVAGSLDLYAPIVWGQPATGNLLTRYLDHCSPLSEAKLNKSKYLHMVAASFKKLHAGTDFSKPVQVFDRNAEYMKVIASKNPGFLNRSDIQAIIAQIGDLEKLLNAYSVPMVRCHNDPNPTNFLILTSQDGRGQKKELKLLDWEYSSNNDFLWDLVYFIYLSQLSPELTDLFLKAYFDQPTEEIMAWLELYKPLVGWWLVLWSWVQIVNESTSCSQSEYRKLAEKSLQETQDLLQSASFQQAFELLSSQRLACGPTFRGF